MQPPSWIAGAWSRPLFAGGGLASTDADETCFNVVTAAGPFVDIRIPTVRDALLGPPEAPRWRSVAAAVAAGEPRPLASLSELEVRLLARQHAFGGFARFESPSSLPTAALSNSASSRVDVATTSSAGQGEQPPDACVCTRHHAIDWNFVGVRRTRPNKWRVRPVQTTAAFAAKDTDTGAGADAALVDAWLELSYANDDSGAPYYHETWVRRADGQGTPSLALRAAPGTARDALLVLSGDHFAYVVARPVEAAELSSYGRSLAEVVDTALARGARHVAEACVLLEAGHGRRSSGWQIEHSLQPWQVGRPVADVLGHGDLPGMTYELEAAMAQGGAAGQQEEVRLGGRVYQVLTRAPW